MPLEHALSIRQARAAELLQKLAPLCASRSELTLEIGCGHGHYLTAYAEAHPDEFCIGVDLLEDRLVRAERKSRRAGLENLSWFHAEAGLFLDVLPAHIAIAKTFVLFPDPWPKRRHHKNRLLRTSFLDQLADRATPTGILCFRTDHVPYFADAVTTLKAHPRWDIATEHPWPFELATVFQQRAEAYQSLVAQATPRDSGRSPRLTVSSAQADQIR